ncbi:MAG: hypothetical protein ABIQ32_02210 [Sphingomicrobium sp.]
MTAAASEEYLKRRAAQERVAAKLAEGEHAQQSHAQLARRYEEMIVQPPGPAAR